MKLKPKVLVDISSFRKKDSFSGLSSRINLWQPSGNKIASFKVPVRLALFFVGALLILCFSSVFAPTLDLNAQTVSDPAEKAALEAELEQLESQIAEYEKTVQSYKQQGSTLKGEIDRLNAQINKLNLQVRSITINLSKLNDEIITTSEKISSTESDMEKKKQRISSAVRDIERSENQNLLEILLANPTLSDFFGNVNNILIIQNNLQEALRELEGLREEYLDQKEQLGLQKTDTERLKEYQESQMKTVASLKENKNEILEVTKGREAEYQKLLSETKKTASEIRARLYRMAG